MFYKRDCQPMLSTQQTTHVWGNYYSQIISPISRHFGLSHTDGPGSTDLSRHGFFASKVVKNNKLDEVEPRLILFYSQQALIF